MKHRAIRTNQGAVNCIAGLIHRGELSGGQWVEDVEFRLGMLHQQEAVAVSSGTMALKIALDAMGVGRDDFVLVPDITFVGCASVVYELGATPIFADVRTDTYLLDEENTRTIVANVGPRLKAIIAVRLAGRPLPDWVYRLGVPVLADSAHSMDAPDPDARATIYSFHPSKIVSGIEGGAILTPVPDLAAEARKLRQFGWEPGTRITNRVGYKGNMTNPSAALIYGNLTRLDATLEARAHVRDQYNQRLGLDIPTLGMYMVTVADPEGVCRAIPAIRHYPMPLSRQYTGSELNPNAERVSRHLISLPFHEWLVDDEIAEVCEATRHQLVNLDAHG